MKLDKRNNTTSKKQQQQQQQKKNIDVILTKCDINANFAIYCQSGAIFIFSSLIILQKLKAELKNLQHSSHTIALSKGTIFAKNAYFYKKMLASTKLEGPWY